MAPGASSAQSGEKTKGKQACLSADFFVACRSTVTWRAMRSRATGATLGALRDRPGE
jgi:hypothetical protein